MILYGLPTCDTCRKALAALRAAGHPVQLQDVRAEPLASADLARALEIFGDRLVNRSSTTWRALSEAERARPAAEVLAAYPALMKRPLIVAGDRATLGWDAAAQAVWQGATRA